MYMRFGIFIFFVCVPPSDPFLHRFDFNELKILQIIFLSLCFLDLLEGKVTLIGKRKHDTIVDNIGERKTRDCARLSRCICS